MKRHLFGHGCTRACVIRELGYPPKFWRAFLSTKGSIFKLYYLRDTLGKAPYVWHWGRPLCYVMYAVFGILITDYSDIVLSTPIVR